MLPEKQIICDLIRKITSSLSGSYFSWKKNLLSIIIVYIMEIQEIYSDAFSNLSDEFQKYIDDNKTGGVLGAVYYQGKLVFCNKFGWKDIENEIPISFDDIFRIYSMTKPITCLAALILLDEGKYNLNDPLEKYLPEFRNLKVLKSYNEETGEVELEDAQKPITIKQLFTHTSGFSYGFFPEVPIDKLYQEKFNFGEKNSTLPRDDRLRAVLETSFPPLEEFSQCLATLPLKFEPGKYLCYSFGLDILGLLIEKLSGKKFDEFLKERIFNKIGMTDTDFFVPPEKRERLVEAYTRNQEGNLVRVTGPIREGFNHKPKMLAGGIGLVSTLDDYLKFCIMMLNGGKYEGGQVISEETIDLMTSNQLPQGKSYLEMIMVQPEDPEIIRRNEGYGFGLGVIVKTAENMLKSGIGDYGWSGALNTTFRIDPKNEVIFIVLTQYCPEDNNWITPIDTLRISDLVYEALEKRNE
ncbi:MAG: beta-lactamase family protein [Candidatus Heimdallarchaeota archaeon]|nr:beta-lactamase family protein [Candidatus Heimdallarchaeota archaeon]